MDMVQILQTLLAFVFVLGLMFVTLWLIKFCQQKGLNCRLNRCFAQNKRIKIIEHHRLDMKNSVVLLECDNNEFLLLLTPSSGNVINQTQKKEKTNVA